MASLFVIFRSLTVLLLICGFCGPTAFAQDAFNKFFRGTLDANGRALSFQMRLRCQNTALTGQYRYGNSTSSIKLAGTIDENNKFVLQESFNGKATGKFEGTLENNGDDLWKMHGVWTKAGSEQFLSFAADEIPLSMAGDVYVQEGLISYKRRGVAVSASYPQFTGGSFAKLNLDLKNVAQQYQRSFAQSKPYRGEEYSLEAGYVIHRADDSVVAIEFVAETFTGGAHPNHNTDTFNYSMKTGKLMRLADLFKPKADYLPRLARLAREQLGENLQFEEGLEPVSKNFSDFLLTTKGLLLYFDEYQVAPYAAGRQEALIPFAELQDIIEEGEKGKGRL